MEEEKLNKIREAAIEALEILAAAYYHLPDEFRGYSVRSKRHLRMKLRELYKKVTD